MKRLTIWLCVLSLLALPASAHQVAVPLQGWTQSDCLYLFASLDGADGRPLAASLRLPDLPDYTGTGELKPLPQSDLTASYLLVVDVSSSMQKQKAAVRAYAEGRPGAATGTVLYSLATVGDQFQLVRPETNDPARLLEALDRQSFRTQSSNLSQGLMDAMDYLDAKSRQPGELVNLVFMTDGILEWADGAPEMAPVVERVNASRVVLTHTFGLGLDREESPRALELLSSLGSGSHTAVGSADEDAAAKGAEVARFANDLYAGAFLLFDQPLTEPLDGEVSVDLPDGEQCSILLQQLPSLDGAAVAAPELPTDLEPPAGGETPSEAETPQPDQPSPKPVIEPPGEEPEDKPEPSEPEPASVEPAVAPEPEAGPEFPLGMVLAAGGVLVVLAAIAVCLLVRRRRRKAPGHGGVYMKLEVLSGSCTNRSFTFELTGELIVGRGRKCDIAFRDEPVDRRNSRIFRNGAMIYIEDLGSRSGTALGGMRLHEPNRLRSGDEISIGPVCFRLLF